MTTDKDSQRPRPLLQLAAVVVALPAVALLARTLAEDSARPVPAAYDTLARFLPADAAVLEIEPSSTQGIFRFEAASPDQEYRGQAHLSWTYGAPALFRSDLR